MTTAVTFYSVPEAGYNPIDWANFHDKQALMAFLKRDGTAEMRVEANGADVTVKVAKELAEAIGAKLTLDDLSADQDSIFNPFLQRHAEQVCDRIWAQLEEEMDDYETAFRNYGAWG